MLCKDLIPCSKCKYINVCPCRECLWSDGICNETCPDAFDAMQQYDRDNRPETKMDVTVVISLQVYGKNSNDDKIKDILKSFKHHDEWQLNDTYIKISRSYVDKVITHGEPNG
jgi:hypothetical protein